MKLMEYMGAALMKQSGIACPDGAVLGIKDDEAAVNSVLGEISYPCVLKAQVEVGGRGKAGGIQTADTPEEARDKLSNLFAMSIKGLPVNKVYFVPKVEIEKEFYLSIMLDRDRRCPVMIFSRFGGMDIEAVTANNPDDVQKKEVDPLKGLLPSDVEEVALKAGLAPEQVRPLQPLVERLYAMFCENDAMLVEINPLVKTPDGNLLALDAKVVVDDSALVRHPEIKVFRDDLDEDPLVVEARSYRFLYIPIEEGGSVAVMSNGSGMIMSCIDLLSKRSVRVGAALDLGGGATADRVAEGIGIAFRNPDISVLFINIFGGITRCDEIAGGVVAAVEKLDPSRSLVVRMEGTNKEAGLEILKQISDSVIVVDNIREGVRATAEKVGQ